MSGLGSPGLGLRIVEPYATSLAVPGHLGNAIGRPMSGLGSPGLGHRVAFRDRSPDVMAPGVFNRSPDAVEGSSGFSTFFWNCHNWHMVLKLSQYHVSTFNQ